MTRFDWLKNFIKGTIKESPRQSHHVSSIVDRFVTIRFYYIILQYYQKLFVNL